MSGAVPDPMDIDVVAVQQDSRFLDWMRGINHTSFPVPLFHRLELTDLGSMMLVCKELKSKLSTDAFLDFYGEFFFYRRFKESQLEKAYNNKSILLRTVTQIDLSASAFNDLSLMQITSEMPRLRTLNLCGSKKVTSHFINFIAENFPNLISLSLSQLEELNEDTVSNLLKRHPGIKAFFISGQVHLKGEVLPTLRHLQVLDLFDCKAIESHHLKDIGKNNPELHSLDLSNCEHLSQEALREIALHTSNLRRLTLKNLDVVSDEIIRLFVENNKDLYHLALTNCQNITDESIFALSMVRNSSLKYLDLSYCGAIKGKFLSQLNQNCKLLSVIGLNETASLDVDNFIALAQTDLSRFHYISLKNCAWLTQQALCMLFNHVDGVLRGLDLRGLPVHAEITDDNLEALVKAFPKLQKLRLSNGLFLTDAGISFLQNLKQLRVLDLKTCPLITDEGLKAIILSCQKLIGLHIRFMAHISDAVIELIKEKLSDQLIELSFCNLRNLSSIQICQLIHKSTHLERLSFEHMNQVKADDLRKAFSIKHDQLNILEFLNSEELNSENTIDFFKILPALQRIVFHWGVVDNQR